MRCFDPKSNEGQKKRSLPQLGRIFGQQISFHQIYPPLFCPNVRALSFSEGTLYFPLQDAESGWGTLTPNVVSPTI